MKQQDMTKGSIAVCFLLFALPLFLGSLFQQLYGTVDMMFVGNYLGKSAAAAVGASSILVTCMIGLFTGIAVGASVLTAQYWGSGEVQKTKTCMVNSLTLGFAGGLLLTIMGLFFSKMLLLLLHTPESILAEALVYIRIYILAVPGMILYNMCAGILRAIGNSKTPFLVLALGGILNVLMDFLFIVILRWGIAGAASATVISQSFTAVVLFALVFRKEELYRENWKPKLAVQKKIIMIGIPLGIQSMILTLSNLFVQYYINGFGEDAIAAFTVYYKAENFIYLPIVAFGQAMVTFTGQNVGAGNYARIRRGAVICNLLSAGIIAVMAGVLLCADRQVLSLFCKDPAVLVLGRQIVHMTFPMYFIYAIMEVTGGIIRGTGKTMQSMLIVIVNLCLLRVGVLSFMAQHFHTVQAIAMVYPITWMFAAASFLYYYWKLERKVCEDIPHKSGGILLILGRNKT